MIYNIFPLIATNERIIIWAVLGFEEECVFIIIILPYMTHSQQSMTIWTNSQLLFFFQQ